MDWVIDTDVLVRADNIGNGHEHYLYVFRLLSAMDSLGDRLTVDYQYRVLREYRNTLRPNGFVGKLLNKFTTRNRIHYVSGELSQQLSAGLRTLRFDIDDDVFVAVASKTTSGQLVAEESDYSCPVVAFLAGHGIRVLDCLSASAEVNRQTP